MKWVSQFPNSAKKSWFCTSYETLPFKNPSGAPIIDSKEADRNVFRSNKIITHGLRILHRSLEHALGADGERDIGGRAGSRSCGGGAGIVAIFPDAADSFARPGNGYAGAEIPLGRAVLRDQTQQQVLRKDHVFPQSHGFSLGEDDRLDGPLRESLESRRDGLPPAGSPGENRV